MPAPRLIHPVKICIQNVDETTALDDITREETGEIDREPITQIKGQINFRAISFKDQITGFDHVADGYFLCKLKNKDDITKNAIITKLGTYTGLFYVVTSPTPVTWRKNGNNFFKVFFRSKEKGLK